MFRKDKVWNSNIWSHPEFRIPMFENSLHLELQCLKKSKFRIPMFRKTQSLELQCLEKTKF